MSTARVKKSLPELKKTVEEVNKTFGIEFEADEAKVLIKLAEMHQKKLKEYKPILETVYETPKRNKP